MSSSNNNRVIAYTGTTATDAAASLEAAIEALDFPAEVVCVALASHDGVLHGVATVRLIEVVDPEGIPVTAGSVADEPAVLDELDATVVR
ncbi:MULTISPECIES: hypothetical protein [unclassified Agrococcus]|uniref:hypothetical protein n=1 Tax=unclassified Agrococcus TaxID=2615065 RepID=UPI00360ACECB